MCVWLITSLAGASLLLFLFFGPVGAAHVNNCPLHPGSAKLIWLFLVFVVGLGHVMITSESWGLVEEE